MTHLSMIDSEKGQPSQCLDYRPKFLILRFHAKWVIPEQEKTPHLTGWVATNVENMENLQNSRNLKICHISVKTQGNLSFCRKIWKTQGKCKICDIVADENVFQQLFLSRGKV